MPSDRPATTIRFTDEDREILERLQKLLGFDSAAAVIRFAIREELGRRQGFTKTKVTFPRK
jgi:Arc/MetJ-type ribon-helix-helix transcriptional regulator